MPLFLLLAFYFSSAADAADFLTETPKYPRLEGTITVTEGAVTTRANLLFQAPNQLRLDIAADPAANVPARTVLAAGDETRVYDPETRRVQRLPYNVAKEWWRGWGLQSGGPANGVLFGWSPALMRRSYTPTPGAPKTAGITNMSFAETGTEHRHWVRDDIRFGGKGDAGYYAAFKRLSFDWPASLSLSFDDKKQTLLTRTDQDGAQKIRFVSTIQYDQATGLPTAAETRDINRALVSRFSYDLKERTAPFAEDAFAVKWEGAPLLEDEPLRDVQAYGIAEDATALFNQGIAYARYAEDLPAAFTAWEGALKLSPQATAPYFAIFEASLMTRDTQRAAIALDMLSRLLGNDHFAVATRRARLATVRRDWSTAKQALEAAQRARPQDLNVTLLRAQLAGTLNDVATEKALLGDILASTAPQVDAQADAAQLLVAITKATDAAEAERQLPNDTASQKLAHALFAIAANKPVETERIADLSARAPVAVALQNAGKTLEALQAWESLKSAPAPLAATAYEQLISLRAGKGEVMEALEAFRALLNLTPESEQARERLRQLVLDAFQKAFRTAQLKPALQQRTLSTATTEDDWRLWMAYQDRFGTTDDNMVAIQAGVERYPASGWWLSRLAEQLMGQATDEAQITKRNTYIRDALRAVQRAIDDDPNQSYYQVQRALILTQRATMDSAILQSGARVTEREQALTALKKIEEQWPRDLDIQLAIGVQRLALLLPMELDAVAAALQTSLRNDAASTAGADSDIHTAASAARQAIAAALRRTGKKQEAARHYETLLAAAGDASEELGLLRNYMVLFLPRPNANESQLNAGAQAVQILMLRMAHEPWEFSASQELMQGFVNLLLPYPRLMEKAADLLATNGDVYGLLGAAHLRRALARVAGRAATAPDAPINAETALREANANVEKVLKNLEPLANEDDHLLSSRVTGMLADDALGRADTADAIKWLRLAVASEPRDLDLQLALAGALIDADQKDAAIKQLDYIAQAFEPNPDLLRRTATYMARLRQTEEGLRLASRALNMAQADATVSPTVFEATLITAARAHLAAGQKARATDLYNSLAKGSTDSVTRLAAQIDLMIQLRDADQNEAAARIKQQIEAAKPTARQVRAANAYLNSLN